MLFKRDRELSNKVFHTKTNFKAYGGTISKEEEKELFENMGYPQIDMGGKYSAKFKVEDGDLVIAEAPEQGTEVSIVLNSNPTTVNGHFSMDFSADAKEEEGLGSLTPVQVAEAKCILFEKELDEKLTDAIKNMVEKKTDFEEDFPKEITIPSASGGEEENGED